MLSDSDSVKHFFFFCPRYAAQSYVLLTSNTASILVETWSLSSNARNIIHDCSELCKFVQNIWLMSEACEIAQLVDLKL